MAGSKLLIGPAGDPLAVAEMRELLRYPTADQDAILAGLIASARQESERYTGRAWMTQTWEQAIDTWPAADGLELVRPPVQTVEKVTLYGPDGAAATDLDPTSYDVDTWSTPARLLLRSGEQGLRARAGLVVTFTAGYGDLATDVPADVRDALATLVQDGFLRIPPEVPALERAWPAKVLDVLRAYRVEYRPRYLAGWSSWGYAVTG